MRPDADSAGFIVKGSIMRALGLWPAVAATIVCAAGPARAGGQYPVTLSVAAETKAGSSTKVSSMLTIRVDRLMDETRRTRVTDALKFGGYPGFLNTLRTFPPVGEIGLEGRKVEVRYSHEEKTGSGRRLVLVADRPLFFFGGDPAKSKAGYELTLVELTFDAAGGATGTMAGAARVKPAPDGGIVLDVYAEAPVQLTVRAGRP
jgi:hypothetical protein